MKSIEALLSCTLCLALASCAGSDSVQQDRFGEVDDGDDGSDGVATTTGDPGGTSGDSTSGDPPTSSGSSGESGASSGTTSGGSSSSGTTCDDASPGEPNESEGSAASLGALDDCDTSGGYLEGVLSGDDVDWYVYHGDDVLGCSVDPYRQVEADGGYRICKFPSCDSGPMDVVCPEGTSAETSPDGLAGCCAQQAFNLPTDCPGWTDSASVYIRVDKPPAYACVHYTLTIHY